MGREARMSVRDRAIALALALAATLAAVLALAAPAGAATYGNGYKLSKFKIEIKGVQKMVQQYSHAAEDDCDFSNFSSGSETLTFRTTKPQFIIASYMKGQQSPEFFSTRQLAIPTKATVKRSYTPRITQPVVPCEFNGGGVENVPQPDCGTKVVKPYEVRLQYSERRRNALLLSSYGQMDVFHHCPGAGSFMGFPDLLVERSGKRGNYIYAELSQDELFDPRFRKWISIAEGSRKERYGDHWVRTQIRWEVSFTRLKERVAGR